MLYKGGILSKRKYCNIRSSEIFDYDIPAKKRKRTEFEEGCRLPALVPYKQLMKFIEVQDIGELNSIPQAPAEGQVEKENEEVNRNLLPVVPGYYIDLKERLLQMADLYLHIDSHIPNFLTWFALHTEPAPAVRAAVKTVLSCQSFALSPETGHFGFCRSIPSKGRYQSVFSRSQYN